MASEHVEKVSFVMVVVEKVSFVFLIFSILVWFTSICCNGENYFINTSDLV